MNHLDPDLLRTFLAFVDGGTLARAAALVGRSPSAVTAQMQRLEDDVGETLLVPQGRRRILTPMGEELAGHARRILEAHRLALLSLKGGRREGDLRIAATQDFTESGLPLLLRRFALTHPRVRLDLRVGRSAELAEAFGRAEIDVLVSMRLGPTPDEVAVLREPMIWLGPAAGLVGATQELPLALLDAPCGFRTAALSALDRVGRPYRIAATSQSLAGLRAALAGGLAVTLRGPRWIGAGVAPADRSLGLPETGEAEFAVRVRTQAPAAARAFGDLMRDTLPGATGFTEPGTITSRR